MVKWCNLWPKKTQKNPKITEMFQTNIDIFVTELIFLSFALCWSPLNPLDLSCIKKVNNWLYLLMLNVFCFNSVTLHVSLSKLFHLGQTFSSLDDQRCCSVCLLKCHQRHYTPQCLSLMILLDRHQEGKIGFIRTQGHSTSRLCLQYVWPKWWNYQVHHSLWCSLVHFERDMIIWLVSAGSPVSALQQMDS